jgi:phosphate/sulfate permease
MELIMISGVIFALTVYSVINKIIRDKKREKEENDDEEDDELIKLNAMDEDLEKLEKENDIETEEEVLEEGEVERSELDKEKGKWLMDISKYILTAFVFTFMVEHIQNKFIATLIAAGVAVVVFFVGTRYLKTKRNKDKKEKKQKKKNINTKN